MSANLISSDIISALPSADNVARFVNEAAFGYRYIAPHLKSLPQGAQVLEIGAGPCILLAQLCKDFPHLNFTGVEPVAAGFKFYADSIAAMQGYYPFSLQLSGYEALRPAQTFDVIFLINVFQHLSDWRHFLQFVESHLSKNGKCLILSPNYGFPYDPHFGIPALWSKRLTYYIFGASIRRFESSKDRAGLWESLNFVRWSQVQSEANRLNLKVISHIHILTDMIDRFDHDPEFARRQKLLSPVAKLLKRSKILGLFTLPIFWRIHPYMFLEITHKNR